MNTKKTIEEKIKVYERLGLFDVDVNDDPPAPILLPENADYECKKLKNKLLRFVANAIADRYFLRMIKKGKLIIDGIENEHILKDVLKNGAVVTCNHFSPYDNYIVFHCIRKYLPQKYLYKVIREGNYTGFKGLYGFFFRHCHTLPLSSNAKTTSMFLKSTVKLLKNGESVLIYPEQAMWNDYEKPRPFKIGAFTIAQKADVPVLPLFITMKDDPKTRLKRHTLHVLSPVYPDNSLSKKVSAQTMLDKAYAECKDKYEEIYGKKLVYGNEYSTF